MEFNGMKTAFCLASADFKRLQSSVREVALHQGAVGISKPWHSGDVRKLSKLRILQSAHQGLEILAIFARSQEETDHHLLRVQ